MVDINERHIRPVVRAEICAGVERRRQWSVEEKGRIVAEAMRPGMVLAAVARQHGLAPQHLSNWIRAAKDGHFALPAEAAGFVPVVMEGPPPALPVAEKRPAGERGTIEITLGKARVRVRPGVDARTLEAVLVALKRTAS